MARPWTLTLALLCFTFPISEASTQVPILVPITVVSEHHLPSTLSAAPCSAHCRALYNCPPCIPAFPFSFPASSPQLLHRPHAWIMPVVPLAPDPGGCSAPISLDAPGPAHSVQPDITKHRPGQGNRPPLPIVVLQRAGADSPLGWFQLWGRCNPSFPRLPSLSLPGTRPREST